MTDWQYWRWVTLRNTPLVVIIFTATLAAGVLGLRALPKDYTATSRTVLETPLALSETPKAARAAQDIQHLQLVVHHLQSSASRAQIASELGVAADSISQDAIALSIESGRDKPTFLTIAASAATPRMAVALSQAIARQSITLSGQLQDDRVEASLVKLVDMAEGHERAATAARLAYDARPGAHGPDPDRALAELVERAANLRDRINGSVPQTSTLDAGMARLQRELAEARGLYSDRHPTVRILQQRISLEGGAPVATPALSTLPDQLAALEQQIAQARSDIATSARLEQALAKAERDREQSQDTLVTARLRGEEGFAHLKLVEDPSLPLTGSDGKRAAVLLALVLLAAGLAAAVVALRQKLDRKIRRPADLVGALGITPFATLPDFGPSLS